MLPISVALLLVTFIFLIFIFTLRKTPRKSNFPPGPSGLPFFGNALEINERNMFDKLLKFADKYGDIVQIKLFHKNIICLNSSEVIRKVLCHESFRDYTNDRVNFFITDFLFYGSQGVASYTEANSVHRAMRKGKNIDSVPAFFHPFYQGYVKALHVYGQEDFSAFEEMILSELNNLNNRIEAFDGKEFDVLEVVRRSLTNVVSVLLSGKPVSDDDKDINMFWDFADEIIFLVDPTVNILLSSCPSLRFFPGFRPNISKIYKAKEKLLERFFINKEGSTMDGLKNFVDVLFEEQRTAFEEGKEVIFTNERIKSIILETVIAGITTTWSILTSTIFCLVNYPEYQDQIFAELDKDISQSHNPNHTDKANCPILEAVELEVHRLFTVVPAFVGRVCTKDLNLEGYDVSKGTAIIANIWRVHHDKKIWDDPWNFRPERFLNNDGGVVGRDSILRQNWMPFSVGRRQCVGEQFARSRYFLFMASLLRKWKFVGVPGKYSQLDPKHLRNFDTKLTLRPKSFFCKAVTRV